MKVIMIYDQIQSGAGIKDDHMIPLGAKKETVGPAVMMEPYLKKLEGVWLPVYIVGMVIMKPTHRRLVVRYVQWLVN